MATAEDALMFYEGAQNVNPNEQLTDTGDRQTFQSSIFPLSNFLDDVTDARPVPRLDGIATGAAITPGAAADTVDIAAGTAYLGGNLVTIPSAAAVGVARPVTDTHLIYAISVDNVGAITAIAGAEGTAFSTVVGANGGPPVIPVGEVQNGLIRLSAQASAVVLISEIQRGGSFTEFTGSPSIRNIDFANGRVTLQAALPQSHTGNTTRQVWMIPFEPTFFQFARTLDWVPAELAGTSNAEPFYSGTISSVSSTPNDATFTVLMDNGVRDDFLSNKNKTLWIKFQPNANEGDHQLTLGRLFVARTNPIANQIQAACTLIPEQPTVDVVV